jgi:hypothetical protein
MREADNPVARISRGGKALWSLLSNFYHSFFSPRVVFFGYRGMGDLIIYARLLENYCSRKEFVVLPVREHDYLNAKNLYSYLRNLVFLIIPQWLDSEDLEKSFVVSRTKNLNVKFVDAIGKKIYYLNKFLKFRGNNRNLLFAGGVLVNDLFSSSFRENALRANQLEPPLGKYAFVHDKPEQIFGPHRLANENLKIRRPQVDEPLWALAKLMDKAVEIRVIESSFMCFSIVAGLGQGRRLLWLDRRLEGDDPSGNWHVDFR